MLIHTSPISLLARCQKETINDRIIMIRHSQIRGFRSHFGSSRTEPIMRRSLHRTGAMKRGADPRDWLVGGGPRYGHTLSPQEEAAMSRAMSTRLFGDCAARHFVADCADGSPQKISWPCAFCGEEPIQTTWRPLDGSTPWNTEHRICGELSLIHI